MLGGSRSGHAANKGLLQHAADKHPAPLSAAALSLALADLLRLRYMFFLP
jgi:hypothetical protein